MIHTGGCQCGAVRYQIKSAPIVAYCCHCTDCQQQSSSAFGMSVWFAAQDFTLTSGQLQFWVTQGESGEDKICALCGQCGTRIYHALGNDAGTLSVKGGSLDDISAISPAGHIWTRSAQPWMRRGITGQTCYETEPDSFDALIKRFQQNTTVVS